MSMSPKWAKNTVTAGLLIIFFGFIAFVIKTFNDGRLEKEKTDPVKVEEPAPEPAKPDWVNIGGFLYKFIDKDNNVLCYKYSGSGQISCVVGYGEAK